MSGAARGSGGGDPRSPDVAGGHDSISCRPYLTETVAGCAARRGAGRSCRRGRERSIVKMRAASATIWGEQLVGRTSGRTRAASLSDILRLLVSHPPLREFKPRAWEGSLSRPPGPRSRHGRPPALCGALLRLHAPRACRLCLCLRWRPDPYRCGGPGARRAGA